MRKLLCLSITIILVMLTFGGCKTKSLPPSVEGQWSLETIFDINGEILAVGKAYSNYNDYNGQKKDIWAVFDEEGNFEIAGSEENLQGKYNEDEKHSTTDTIAITMNFDNGTKSMAAFGMRQYKDSKKVGSLIFATDEKIYSFIRLTDHQD